MFLKERDGNRDVVVFHDNDQNIIGDSVNIQHLDTLYVIDHGLKLDTLENSLIGRFLKKGRKFNVLDKEAKNEKISGNISYATFLLMPVFALYLGIFLSRRKRYLENIVFSLHFHSFFFVAGTIFLLINKFIAGDLDTILFYLLVLFYLVVAIKIFYSFSWISLIVRSLALVLVYGLTVSIFLIAANLISVLI